MAENIKDAPKIIILMSTYNGERFLEEQLKSLYDQDYENVMVFARDDGSTDGTDMILEKWSEKKPDWLSWYRGDNIGPARSFMELLAKSPQASYYAFCDQDDFWMPDKISSAVRSLEKCESRLKLYCSNVEFVDTSLNHLGLSSFGDNKSVLKSLIYNQAVGCTMVINYELRKVCCAAVPNDLIMHDCWIYRTCVALGGSVCFDHDSHIKYRQHENNYAGGSSNPIAKWVSRIKMMQGKRKNKRKRMALELIDCYDSLLSVDNRALIGLVAHYDDSLENKISFLKHRDIYTNNVIDNLSIVFATFFNLI